MKNIKTFEKFINEMNLDTLKSAASKALKFGHRDRADKLNKHSYSKLEGDDIFELMILSLSLNKKKIKFIDIDETSLSFGSKQVKDIFKKVPMFIFNFKDVVKDSKYRLKIILEDGIWRLYDGEGDRDSQNCGFFIDDRKEAVRFLKNVEEYYPDYLNKIKELGEFNVNSILTEGASML